MSEGRVLSEEEVNELLEWGYPAPMEFVIDDLIATIRDRDKTIATLAETVHCYKVGFDRVEEQNAILLAALDKAVSTCPMCRGTGLVDSGGFTQWDTPINIPCPDCSPMREAIAKVKGGSA